MRAILSVSVPFTRDYDTIRAKLLQLEEGDKTCIENALHGVNQLVMSEWGLQIPMQIILVTDGSSGVGAIGRNRVVQALPLPPLYPVRIHVLPIVSPLDPSLQHAMPIYQKIVELATSANSNSMKAMSRGVVYCPDQLSLPGITTAVSRLCEQQYAEACRWLRCGRLEARVQLYPPAQAVVEGGPPTHPAHHIHIIGFITQQDWGTPPTISRHLVLPQPQTFSSTDRRDSYTSKMTSKENQSSEGGSNEEDASDPSKIPNFCVLLHGALKVESMAAVVSLGEGWWGALSAVCEPSRARRSCLVLCALAPGMHAAPWLGPLDQLGPAGEEARTTNESIVLKAARSYTSGGCGGAAWARPHALLADVQKVLRHARKLPDKTQHLYKELNRLRRAAISLGFTELLACVGAALERECAALPANAPAECSLQLAHAAAALRDPRAALDAKYTVQPLTTNFGQSRSSSPRHSN
ncbi:Integrator complex subunit 14 [Eumeta japonica]|uniref:Integrator complex subunit 14 n=1 Tax=Eumeta variegata TaxID=151549 RepID=A0A4C1VE66_EUMVA|nr:Integrator complex subunit 14 [Eumeta japonica]